MLTTIILLVLFSITFCILINTVFKLFKRKESLEKQNLKVLNLYLDKRFVSKLLKACLDTQERNLLQSIMQEMIHYFCLDFVALCLSNRNKIITFHKDTVKKYFTISEVRKFFESLNNLEIQVGNMYIKSEDHRQLIGFKHNELTMLTVLEANHKLATEEIETLGNEIMLLIKFAIFSTINKTTNLNSDLY